MAACFSSSGICRLPPIFVLSKISKLTDCLKACAIPQIEIEEINIPNDFEKDPTLTVKFSKTLKDVEIAVCDSDILASSHKFMPNLKWAHSTWAGVEGLFKAIPNEPQFTVTRHSGEAFTTLMAEYAVCHILNCERKSRLCWKNQESKIWLPFSDFSNYRSLNELNVGILGVGNMGCRIASFLKSRGTTVYGFARRPRAPGPKCYFDEIYANLDEILPKCDYVCNVLPSTPHTIGILNNSMLKLCSKKPVFINIGRGDVISEDELINALRKGWISGAVLDVFEEEPLPVTSQLWDMPEVAITPHVSALSKPEHIAEEFFQNLISYIDGHSLQNVVNWTAGY